MTIRFNPRWLFVSILLFSLQFCRAQVEVPSTISFDLGGDDASPQLWDLSGNYRLDLTLVQRNGLTTPLGLSFTLVQDASGRLSSPADAIGDLEIGDNSLFAVTCRTTGKVTGSDGVGRVHFTIRISGSGTLAGKDVQSFSATFTVDAETDPLSGQLTGGKRSKFSASFPTLGAIRGSADFFTALPTGANGAWNLSLQLAALSKLTGTAIVTTPNRAMGLNLSGSYKSKTGIFKIKAKGAVNVPGAVTGVGSSASIQLTSSFDTMQFKGKMLGQKLSFLFIEPETTSN